MKEFDSQIRETAKERLKASAVFFFGLIEPAIKKPKTISVILQTSGGSAKIVEKLAEILRYCYDSVNFIILNYAMSAGTLFALSGNKIYMNYFSSLDPIDPRVPTKETIWSRALGYLD